MTRHAEANVMPAKLLSRSRFSNVRRRRALVASTIAGQAAFILLGIWGMTILTPFMGPPVVLGVFEATLAIGVLGLTFWAFTVAFRRFDALVDRISQGLEDEIATRMQHSLRTEHALIFGLANLADHRDTDTGTHLERICTYSELLANELRTDHPQIDDYWIEQLKLASSLHDIGKVGIPDEVLLKPGRLDEDERRIMETHAEIGARTLRAIRERFGDDALLDMAIDIAAAHHEHWDGNGYPRNLRSEQIPLSARIIAVADVYDALTSKRVYKPAMPHDKAAQIIMEGRGSHFDPAVADTFARLSDKFDEARRSLQHAEDPTAVGIVLEQEAA